MMLYAANGFNRSNHPSFFCSHSVTEVGIVFSLHFFATISTIHIDFVWFSNHVLNRQIFSWHCSKRRVESACVWGLPKMEMMLETPPPIGPQKKQSNFLQLQYTFSGHHRSIIDQKESLEYYSELWLFGPYFYVLFLKSWGNKTDFPSGLGVQNA